MVPKVFEPLKFYCICLVECLPWNVKQFNYSLADTENNTSRAGPETYYRERGGGSGGIRVKKHYHFLFLRVRLTVIKVSSVVSLIKSSCPARGDTFIWNSP